MISDQNLIEVRVQCITFEALGIHSLELRPLASGELPRFTAGAHVDVHLANGMQRSYSLSNDPKETHRYVVAVSLDQNSRGASRFIHEKLQVGQILRISLPRNNFELAGGSAHTVMISGGIGITPFMSMIATLERENRSWELYFCARNRASAAFLDRIKESVGGKPDRLHVHLDDEAGSLVDIGQIVERAAAGSHLYCCGPVPMLDAFLAAAGALPEGNVHVEYFAAKEAPALEGGFTVLLARTQREIFVASGETILDAVLEAGLDVAHSCMEGICGACETAVIDGIPDHRDVVLTKEEQLSNRTMMICCSGCKSARLTLDL